GTRKMTFGRNSLPALRSLAPLVAQAILATHDRTTSLAIEELGLKLTAAALRATGEHRSAPLSRHHERRVAAIARFMEERFGEPCSLHDLARHAGLSPFHFLRVFRATTGLTPHQHLLRTRLRAAASHLARTNTPVTEVALAAGFEDLSNFTRTFRAEYALTPSRYRLEVGRRA